MSPGFPPHKLTAHFIFEKMEWHDGVPQKKSKPLTQNLRSSIGAALDRSRRIWWRRSVGVHITVRRHPRCLRCDMRTFQCAFMLASSRALQIPT